jgi:hypothetical protein
MSKPKVQINVKFEAPRPSREGGTGTPGLPGSVISFYIVPLDPTHSAGLPGHVPVKARNYNFAFWQLDFGFHDHS